MALVNISGTIREKFLPLMIFIAVLMALYEVYHIAGKSVRLAGLKPSAGTNKAFSLPVGQMNYKKEPVIFYNAISERNLFGSTRTATSERRPSPTAVIAPPVYTPPDILTILELKGTIAGNGEDGFAVIEEKGKNRQMPYKVGDTVAGVKLVEIRRNSVVILDGKDEKILRMEGTTETPLLASRVMPARSTAAFTAVPPPGKVTMSKSDVGAGLADLGKVLSQAQIRTHFQGGKPDGLLISNIQPDSIYKKIGFIDGDVLQELNGGKVQYTYNIMELYKLMREGKPLTLKVLRKGKQETFSYNFK